MPDHSVAFDEAHRRFGQIQFWTHLEEVKPGMAPLQLVPREFGKDMSKAVELVCPAGTICIFTNYTCKTQPPLPQSVANASWCVFIHVHAPRRSFCE
jgi:hypothetical protein